VRFFLLFCRAYLKLIYFDLFYARGNVVALYKTVRSYPVANKRRAADVQNLCLAMDFAIIWYFREVPCLLRSAALVCLLRDFGEAGKLVTASQQMPYKSHAWAIDAAGQIVNDKPYAPEIYTVLDYC
jgi:hypothetical protein